MNKQEFQKTIRNMEPPKHFSALTFKEAFNEGFNSAKNDALFNSCFLNEPEKPVVPQYVADFYESIKDDFEYGVYELCVNFYNCDLSGKIKHWFDCNDTNPIQVLVNMHQFGYEVEKEKLYTVELPNPNGGTHLVLCKDCDGKLFFDVFFSEEWKTFGKCKLTESEIKKDFEWAWQFAKEVEND
jgi:hypothetical protein|nr:MAG TPA: Protein of unknown function (DUF1642) [Caudoviricetes sp.]